ncbi:MAG: alpha/beta hydrolase [Pseudonocardia sp.]|nr:alpha/beta hydrolase [Pseudonocardia sp.]
MPISPRAAGLARLAVLLPGTGSDEVFVTAAFAGPLRAVGIPVLAVAPGSGAEVVANYLRALDQAMEDGEGLLVGGVSLGAQVAARWAAGRAGRGLAGLLLALPAWTGDPGSAPAATAAAASAAALRRDGLAATIERTRARTPEWLGGELARAWSRHADGLADSLEAAAATPGPTEGELAALRVPVGLVGLRDDPVHPLAVARRWHALLPRSALVTSTLEALGRDRASIGRAAVLAWLRARPPLTTGVVGDGARPGAAGPG